MTRNVGVARDTARQIALAIVLLLVAGGCSSGTSADDTADSGPTSLTIYTTVTQDTVDAVVAAFQADNPEVEVEVFRAPTGELTARIAAETREGGLGADILWLTDPLSIQQYANDGLLREWTPNAADAVPAEYRTETFFGTRILNLVIVASTTLSDAPSDWAALTTVDGVVAIPDPGFAGSAFGALGFFASSPDFGLAYYQALRDNGAVQVKAPGDVVTGVAEGLYAAGISLDRTVSSAVDDGSPVQLIWPESGAIAVYSPVAVVDTSNSAAAEPFVEFVLGTEAQQAIADTGWQPIRGDVEWPDLGPQLTIDWENAFDRQTELLDQYMAIFGT